MSTQQLVARVRRVILFPLNGETPAKSGQNVARNITAGNGARRSIAATPVLAAS